MSILNNTIPQDNLIKNIINNNTTNNTIYINHFYKLNIQLKKNDFAMIRQKNNNCYWRAPIHLFMKLLSEEGLLNSNIHDYNTENTENTENTDDNLKMAKIHYKLMLFLKSIGRNKVVSLNDKYSTTNNEEINDIYCSVHEWWTMTIKKCCSYGFANTMIIMLLKHLIELLNVQHIVQINETHTQYITNAPFTKDYFNSDYVNIYNTFYNNQNYTKTNKIQLAYLNVNIDKKLQVNQSNDLQTYLCKEYDYTYNETDKLKEHNDTINLLNKNHLNDVPSMNCIDNKSSVNFCTQKVELIRNHFTNDCKYVFTSCKRTDIEDTFNKKSIQLNNILVYDDCILMLLGCILLNNYHYTTLLRDGSEWQYYYNTKIYKCKNIVNNNNILDVKLHNNKHISNTWDIALYKIIKRGINVIVFDSNLSNKTITFIYQNINNESLLFHIISCNLNITENTKNIKYHYLDNNNCNENKVYKLAELCTKIYIDSNPSVINECIKANCVNYLHDNMVLYYELPTIGKYIKIEKQNKMFMKINNSSINLNTTMNDHDILTQCVEEYTENQYTSIVSNIII